MTTELDWIGFTDAVNHKEYGLCIVDDMESRAAVYGEHNVCQVPGPDTPIDWPIVLGYGFHNVTLAMTNRLRQTSIIRTLARLAKPPVVEVYDRATNKILPAYRWIAETYIRGADGDSLKLLEHAYEFDSRSAVAEYMQLGRDFWTRIREVADMTNDEVIDYYRAIEYKRKQRATEAIMKQALDNAGKHLVSGNTDAAAAAYFAGYGLFEKYCNSKPLQTVADRWQSFAVDVAKWRNRDIIGFESGLPSLTSALLGLRGLVILGAEANLGKTLLTLQMAVQAVRSCPDLGCLFLSLEMPTNELITRAACSSVQTTWRQFVLKGTNELVAQAGEELATVIPRLVIIDRDEFSGGTAEILTLLAKMRERTGVKRVMVCLDYVQVMDVPSEQQEMFTQEIQIERWRAEELKKLKLSLQADDCIIAISEVTKAKEADGRLTIKSLTGAARLGYAADTVLLWQQMTAEDKWEHLESNGISAAPLIPPRSREGVKKEELKEHEKVIDGFLKSKNTGCAWLDIAKSRDGTVRQTIPITAHYDQLVIREGFLGGNNEGATRETGETENDLESILA